MLLLLAKFPLILLKLGTIKTLLITQGHQALPGPPNNGTSTHDSAIPGSSTSTGQNFNDISFDNALPGPSTIPETPCFDRVEIVLSPWKNHLKISKNVIINRKVQAKSKVPFVVTGDSYINAEEKRNAEKKKKLEEKEECKRIREAKKRVKQLSVACIVRKGAKNLLKMK